MNMQYRSGRKGALKRKQAYFAYGGSTGTAVATAVDISITDFEN